MALSGALIARLGSVYDGPVDRVLFTLVFQLPYVITQLGAGPSCRVSEGRVVIIVPALALWSC